MSSSAFARSGSTWAPLRIGMFRALWLAQLVSNVGTWMQTVGAQWMLVEHPRAEALVSLVQTANTLPFLFLALPAGVLADTLDRRRLLIVVQASLFVIAAGMAGLTVLGWMTPALLLSTTFVLGGASALGIPAWQAIIPDLVPRDDLPSASALGGVNQNLARAVGPALAGLFVSKMGVGVVFFLNALSFLGVIFVLWAWRKEKRVRAGIARERMGAALRAGARYVLHAPEVRRLLLRMTLFVVPATAIWALLPVVANRSLGMGASGYGLLLAALGVGAIAGALILPWLRQRLSLAWFIATPTVLCAAALAVVGLAKTPLVVVVALLAAGLSWLLLLSHVNASLQQLLPAWVRARGLATYQLAFMGSQAISAAAWGLSADRFGLGPTFVAAAIVLLGSALTIPRWPLHESEGVDPTTATYWPEPTLSLVPEPSSGPVLVLIRYKVSEENHEAFVEAMLAVGLSRRRTGATSWDLFRDGAEPELFVEAFFVASWDEHLRQHEGRVTGADRELELRALALVDAAPEVTHLFSHFSR